MAAEQDEMVEKRAVEANERFIVQSTYAEPLQVNSQMQLCITEKYM